MKGICRMKKFIAFLLMIIISLNSVGTVYAADVPNKETPNYKVAFFPYDCFNMQDEDGERSGYGYEMMQTIANYLQCTFSYVGYDKSAAECVEMLRNGELDIYTAAKRTTEREKEFIFSRHPSITAMTCMTVKVGNTKVVAGEYDTYNGLRIGLLERHTYNGKFEEFAKSKGFSYALLYYDTPEELTNALITGEVDALVNSYISTPEDERVVEELEQTPYYLMARKENQALMDEIDYAIDIMNVDRPTWRADLFNQYYGISSKSTDYTEEEQSFLDAMRLCKRNHAKSIRLHLFVNKIYSHRNTLFHTAHLIAQVKSICLKHDIRLKSFIPAFTLDKFIQLKSVIFQAQCFPCQVFHTYLCFFRKRVSFIYQQTKTAFFQTPDHETLTGKRANGKCHISLFFKKHTLYYPVWILHMGKSYIRTLLLKF